MKILIEPNVKNFILRQSLTARQDENLRRYGYPYVFSEVRFHITLTNAISDAAKRTAVVAVLRDFLARALTVPPILNAISVFRQDNRGAPFTLQARFECRG